MLVHGVNYVLGVREIVAGEILCVRRCGFAAAAASIKKARRRAWSRVEKLDVCRSDLLALRAAMSPTAISRKLV